MKLKMPKTSVDRMFRAFSDRTRLRILHLLESGELCVCDLVAVLEVPQPKISRHLSYLRQVGLVTARKEGLWSYYKLAPAPGAFHRKMLECLATCFSEVPELVKDAADLESRRASCCGGRSCCD
jgi:ArsR family transcriptional regulator